MDAVGNFVIAWHVLNDDVYARRFSSTGVPLGAEFRVNTITTGGQGATSVAMDTSGSFVVTWSSPQDGDSTGIYAQRFNTAGVTVGGEFRANTYTTSAQSFPTVAMDADGDFVIAWTSTGQDGSSDGVYAQRFDNSGLPQGEEFRVNTYTSDRQWTTSAAIDTAGNFVVTWISGFVTGSAGQDGDGNGVFGQRYFASGAPRGSEFRINITTIGSQHQHGVAMDDSGDFVVAWADSLQDGDNNGIIARVFADPPTLQPTLINDGAQQRSRISSLTIHFDTVVTLPATPQNAFELRRQSDYALVNLNVSVTNDSATHVVLSFAGPLSESDSLADGNYTLSVLASQVADSFGQLLDGNGDGTPSDNYTFSFHRLFGDSNGDAIVSAIDFNAFRLSYGTGPSLFDFNNDGQTNAADFAAFLDRYGVTLVP